MSYPTTPAYMEDSLVAQQGLILSGEVGSTAHGMAVTGQDDRDVMGVTVEPPERVVGLHRFEQYIYRTAVERARREHGSSRPGGRDPKSQHGDLDFTVYSLRKWASLAARGNPTILLLLYLPRYETQNWAGKTLLDHAELFASKEAGYRFMGYLKAQRERLTGERGNKHGVHREDLVERYGFDTKFAAHAVRLGYQGIELMQNRRLRLPMWGEALELTRGVREGMFTMQGTLSLIHAIEARLADAVETTFLPEHVNEDEITRLVTNIYTWAWAE